MVEILTPLPARPPTPPRPGSRVDQDRQESPVAAQTPGELSKPDPRAPSSSRSSKRVTFSPCINYTTLDPTTQSPRFAKKSKGSKTKESSNVGSPHSTTNRPFKSILKETSSPIPVWSPNVDTFTTESLAMLLESVIQQLAGDSIPSRLDAYMQFFGALRTYDGLPAGKDIADKLGLITDFIQRDVSRNLVDSAPLDTNLANQALKLCAAFVWHDVISKLLTDDFKVFLVEHAITCLQEAKVPKSVLTHYMSILTTQNLGPKVMTGARVTRILIALQDVTKRVSGKAIALHRLSIYQRLLVQSKSTFLSHSALWVEHLISGLLHHLKDTRSKAITLGFQISMAAGPSPVVSKSIRELFDRPIDNDRKLGTEIRERMSRMMGSVDSGIHVPQIWSIIVLLLRSKKRNLDQWEHFKEWVLVLQKCFNCSESAIKTQAIVSWNRFVYAVSPDESTGRSLLRLLGKPVLSQFERKKSDKSGSPPTQIALTSYYNLLYYAFRPSPPHHYLDIIWEEYVAIPSANTFSTMPALSDSASHVLANLLWTQQAKVWTENRINDTNKMEVEELPSVDPRWVRSRISSVLKVFESLFKSSVWDDTALDRSNIATAWDGLVSALSLASSKEITPSGESMQAVASVFGLLYNLWVVGPSSLNAVGDGCVDVFFERFRYLSTTTILSLGGIPFTEKLLLKTADETFPTANITTHRNSDPGIDMDSPILHLLRIVKTTTIAVAPSSSYTRLVNETIDASCNGRISRGSRLELLQQCATFSSKDSASSHQMHALLSEEVWKSSARAAADALQSFPIESARERDGSVSRDYDNVTKILASGLQFPNGFQEWSHLLEAFVHVVRTEKGDRLLATLIVEPVAEFLMQLSVEKPYLRLTSILKHALSIPFMQETGLGIENTVAQQESSPPISGKLLEVIGVNLHKSYILFNSSENSGLDEFIESLTSFVGSGVNQFRSDVLQVLQLPLGVWVKDSEHKFDASRGVNSRTMTASRALSHLVLNVLNTCVYDELSSYKKFECIICAGLESSHLSRALRFLDFWEVSDSARDPLSESTPMRASAYQARSRLIASNYIPKDYVVEKPKSMLLKDQQTISLPPSPNNSSPVIDQNLSHAVESVEPAEPRLPDAQPQLREDRITDDISIVPYPASRREVFRMIENIQSSSPAHTPGRLGYDTPVHLRRLHNLHGGFEFPLTPTLAPAENEDGFVGSSPTPATRDPTPAMNSDAPVLKPQDIAMDDAPDLPSSPPELGSRSPSPQKGLRRQKGSRRRASKAKKAMQLHAAGEQGAIGCPAHSMQSTEVDSEPAQADVSEDPKENDAVQANEMPPSRRTRSALGHSTDNGQNPTPTASFETSPKPTASPSMQSTKSKSGSKKKRRRKSSKPNSEEAQQAGQSDVNGSSAPTPGPAPDYSVDSSSEDVETQIASQLELDLELAVDLGEHISDKQHEDPRRSPVSTKKRKRNEDESGASTAKDRRRSTRLSSTKGTGAVDMHQADAMQDVPEASQATSAIKTSSPTLRRSTRGSQRNDDEPTTQVSESTQENGQDQETPRPPLKKRPRRSLHLDDKPEIQVSQSTQETGQDQETPQPPSKRSRKSLRLDDESTQAITEETSSQAKSARDTGSRKARSSRPENQPQPQPETVAVQDHQAGQDIVPDSNIEQERQDQPSIPFVSTEEATDSQMTDIGSSADVQVGMVVDERPPPMIEQVANISGAEYHTTPKLPQSDPSEGGIAESLKKLLGDMKSTTLGPEALREVDDLLFNIRVEAHEASRRHNA